MVGIVECFERRSVGESLRRLMHTVQLSGRSADHFPRRVVAQYERAAIEEGVHEWPTRVAGRHVASQPRRKVTEFTEQPRELHVAQRDLAEGLEDGLRRRLDGDGDTVAERGAARGGFECRR